MRDLVLGSDGFIGKPLCEYLRAQGNQVVGIDIRRGSDHDLRRIRINTNGFDRIFFLAWDVGGSKYLYKSSTQAHQISWNCDLLANVMPQLKNTNFLFVSSRLAEDCSSAYGVMKKSGEVWSSLYGGKVLRIWNVYGTLEQIGMKSHLISDLVNQAVISKKIRLLTDGLETRQFVHVEDVARAFEIAFANNITKVYDVTSNIDMTVLEVANMIARVTGVDVEPREGFSARGKEFVNKEIDILPSWTRVVSFNSGVYRLIDEAKQRHESDTVHV